MGPESIQYEVVSINPSLPYQVCIGSARLPATKTYHIRPTTACQNIGGKSSEAHLVAKSLIAKPF
jgi:hypothetical protein